ncbi:hypothetical protein M378DRAFT_184241 [Amanita muscaria Koide BX008]|uniref:Inositol-pentakisphosphate 2-kinase n=1 Tax=Amanita muscaria (strain Koide BX008) TaxID=946122 RepID=A0A0C2XK28_AMAMK|nr:hypothetical protein M378DRAFT_184241 [Amanita muscaria Koide BX008]
MARITDTHPSDWRYVSEGGATVVFSYIGDNDFQFNNTVLRLRKKALIHDGKPTEDPIIEFQRRCTSRLIPLVHLPRLDIALLDKEWLESFVALHDSARPEDRRAKDSIDVTSQMAVLATDLVGGDWIAVEIKPKWAFLPSPKYLSPETDSVKTKTCRFCMHSRVRGSRGEAQAVGYCPLDLFSGEEGRMRCAISNLWDAWMASDGAINNLKIFVRGILIRPSEARSMCKDDSRSISQTKDVREAFISALVPLLLGTPVLRTISHLQRTLDALDIEGLSKLCRDAEHDAAVLSEPTINDWDEFVSEYLSSKTSNLEPDIHVLRYHLLAYLLSATFKDCSLIIRLNHLDSESGNGVQLDRVSVIDLDKKSMTRIKQWERLDREIVEDYMKLGYQKICVE